MTVAVIVIAVMALLALVYIALPLLNRREAGPWAEAELSRASDEEAKRDLLELLAQRDSAYQAIKEIEFDHKLGNLSDADLTDLREQYKLRALNIIRAIREREQASANAEAAPAPGRGPGGEPVAVTDDAASAIERAVARHRRASSPSKSGGRACPKCGLTCDADARFCSGCGQPLATTCPACGRPHDPADNFCVGCGARLQSSPQSALPIG